MLFFDIPYYQEEGTVSNDAVQIVVDYNSTDVTDADKNTDSFQNMNLMYFLGALGFLSLAIIFFYKKRSMQMRLVWVNFALLVIVFYSMYFYSVANLYTEVESHRKFLAASAIPLSIVILNFLAYRAIKRDNDLVKSLDRIR